MKKIRYYNENIGANKNNESKAFAKALEICQANEDVNKINMLVHTKRHTGYIERIFGKELVNQLFSGVKTQDNVNLKLRTLKTFNNDSDKNVIITFGLDSKDIYPYDDCINTVAIIAHQWCASGVDDWAKTWGAINLETGKTIERVNISDLVVREALNNLNQALGSPSSIIKPYGEKVCKTYIRALHKYNYPLISEEIFSYLLYHLNWKTKYASEVIKLVDTVNSGRYFQGGEKTGLNTYIKKWQKETGI